VFERAPEGVTYGWGVVFWDGLLEDLGANDPISAAEMGERAFRWHEQVVQVDGRPPVRLCGSGYSMRRRTMLEILTARARAVGADLRFEHEVADLAELTGYDLVVACDGAGSRARQQHADAFRPVVRRGGNKYIWLGTTKVFGSFTFRFARTDAGWLWAHAYGFGPGGSTFIVETSGATWRALGFDALEAEATMRELERIFADQLDGHPLQQVGGTAGPPRWLEFQTVTNARWHHGNLALMGDAAHTTHFTIGSGTRLALEDAMGLARALEEDGAVAPALATYGRRRADEIAAAQREARSSQLWFEQVPRYIGRDPHDFARLFSARRSPLVRRLPPRAYLGLARAAAVSPAGTRIARRVLRY
jgi:2-polyprenyl-6-methoxyphenol hydroxylase-like FAD-dependent oxidoreductase